MATSTTSVSRPSRRTRRLVRNAATVVALTGLSVGVCAGAIAATPEPPSESTGCSFGVWPASVQGRDAALHDGADTGTYLWHDANGFHLRVTHPGTNAVVFTGQIRSTQKIHDIDRIRLEAGDSVRVSNGAKVLTYRFGNHGHEDGIDFKAGCTPNISLLARVAGHRPADKIFLGSAGEHPASDPATISRVS